MITITNEDNAELMSRLNNESVDVICIDPPYKYLKNQKLEVDFDELNFFTEAKRVLTKDGFIIMFGRGVSFYRMNCILADLGFTFKEEIIWDKTRGTSPLLPISRIHETVSIFCKGAAGINKVKVPYLEMKKENIPSVISDIKRLKAVLSNSKSLIAVQNFLKNNDSGYHGEYVPKNKLQGVSKERDRAVTCLNQIENGMSEKTIIRGYNEDVPIKHCVNSREGVKERDRAEKTFQSMEFGLNEKTIMKEHRDHYTSIHPTQKPVRLLERLILLCLPEKPKELITVADFFGGSMSTMEACINLGVNGISCEIDKEYFESGKERIDNLK